MVEMDDIYKSMSPKDIPWNIEEPPDVLVNLVESGRIKPCGAIDLGCGAGNYAVWLASKGFNMTGVDISPAAIQLAKDNAKKKGMDCEFIALDLLGKVSLNKTFDFAYDWEVLHHIFPNDRKKYADNVHKLLKPGANYLSVCFSEDDSPGFGGPGKIRKTRIGTELYFSSEKEIHDLFSPLFEIIELKTIEVKGKSSNHTAIQSFMKKE